MQDFKPYIGPVKLILAFDIGTTYSGVSYCILEPNRVPEVLTVARFPAQGIACADAKVPSLLYYDKSGNVRAAGAEVFSENTIETAVNQGWTKAEWWKLHLRPKRLASAFGLDNELPPLPSGKSAVDVLADFIKYLSECCRSYIQEHHPEFTWSSIEHSTEYVLTYPGGWEEQKCLYRRAIERAGLAPGIPWEQPRVHMLTEAEASLHFCVPYFNEQVADREARQCVVIIDAGGGLVDLSMFSMTSNPMSCQAIAPAESRPQGSIFVTRRAGALIQRKLRDWEHSNARDMARCTREFDETTKFVIESDQEPVYIRVAGRRTNSSRYRISSGQLKLSGEEATSLFDESIDAITSAFQLQQQSASMSTTAAFLVGGLSANDWVWSRLQLHFTAKKIPLRRQDACVNKVVAKGAVLSRVVQETHLGVAYVTRGEDCTSPVKSSKARMHRKALLRDYISRSFAGVLVLARKCNIREWFWRTEKNLMNLDKCESGTDISSLTRFSCSEYAGQGFGVEEKHGYEKRLHPVHPPVASGARTARTEETATASTEFTHLRLTEIIHAGLDIRVMGVAAAALNSLGVFLLTRYERLGQLGCLEDAISSLKAAVDSTPHGHPDKPCRLANLGYSMMTRFQHCGELQDLEDAILTYKTTADLTDDGHPDKPGLLNNLGSSLRTRFERLGELRDLEDAISTLKAAVDLQSGGHPAKFGLPNNFGNPFRTRFERCWELSDLVDAISAHKATADHTPDCYRDKSTCPNSRFDHLGELRDFHTTTIDPAPGDHPDKLSYFNSLANSFGTRFECLGESRDPRNAISLHKTTFGLASHGHPDQPGYLNLGTCFRTHFQRLVELNDVEDIFFTPKTAIDVTSYGRHQLPSHLNSLAAAFFTRFQRLGELGDLEEAISNYQTAVVLTPYGYPVEPSHLNNLGLSFKTRFECLGQLSDLEDAISAYSHAALSPFGPIGHRFQASQKWILCAHCIGHPSLLHAYSAAVNLLPQLAWIGLSLSQRHTQLVRHADLAREAAAAALNSKLLETAVEWLEQGHSIVLGDQLQLRTSYEQLSSAHPDHARRFRELSAGLEYPSASLQNVSSEWTRSGMDRVSISLQQEIDSHHALAIERDRLLQEIRTLPGFERFLLQKEFSCLRASAHAGPVVILNASESRCDALVILANKENVVHVPLPNFALDRCGTLQNTLVSLLGTARVVRGGDRTEQVPSWQDDSWKFILSTLWRDVVKPVFDVLGISSPGSLSRIFWCPMGPFASFPIHAAGFYGTQYSEPGHKVFDFVISSYVPTLGFLVPPVPDTTSPDNFRMLVVPQPPSDGQIRPSGVQIALENTKAVIKNTQSTLLESSAGTVEEVLALMEDADWVHFACHGVQDSENLHNSGLCLADGRRLKLSDMISLSRPRGGLAFLSQCHSTATGDKKPYDEAMYLAAGMLYAGYGGVISTTWSISDDTMPFVVKSLYTELFRPSAAPDYREAARALHKAVQQLRENNASFTEWVPFVHVGL